MTTETDGPNEIIVRWLIAKAQDVLSTNPDYPYALVVIVGEEVPVRRGKLEEAKEHMRRVLRRYP